MVLFKCFQLIPLERASKLRYFVLYVKVINFFSMSCIKFFITLEEKYLKKSELIMVSRKITIVISHVPFVTGTLLIFA